MSSESSFLDRDMSDEELDELVDIKYAFPQTSFISSIINQAFDMDASDIHFNPARLEVEVFFRARGSLIKMSSLPYDDYNKISFELKRAAKVNTVSKKPADGRVLHDKADGSTTALRFATTYCQMFDADKITMRLAGTDVNLLDLAKLKFRETDIKRLKIALRKNFGLVLVTGPTGSGKTTTLYSALNYIKNLGTLNILTAEDPVESPVDRVVQIETTSAISFEDILKSFLRHDPDIIMIGETRNQETAEISVRAALTGHLVLTTLHANTALLSITRMIDLGVDPFNLVFTTACVLNQRLLKTLCPHCKVPEEAGFEAEFVFKKLNKPVPKQLFQKSKLGCPKCMGGIGGRVVVYELLTFDIDDQTEMFEIIKGGRSLETEFLAYYGKKYDFLSLSEMAGQLVENGEIAIDEILSFMS